MTKSKKGIVAWIVGIVVALTGGVAFGGVYSTVQQVFPSIKVGENGSSVNQIIKGTGSLIASSFTVTATTTSAMDLAVPGVESGDIVFAQFATSSAASLGWSIVGASASTTDGYITLRVANMTGANAIIPASLASSTPYLVIR